MKRINKVVFNLGKGYLIGVHNRSSIVAKTSGCKDIYGYLLPDKPNLDFPKGRLHKISDNSYILNIINYEGPDEMIKINANSWKNAEDKSCYLLNEHKNLE